LVDSVICQLMSGKEAMIYLVSCGEKTYCAKVYKENNQRNFHQNIHYIEGRKIKNSRSTRAIKRGSAHGRRMREKEWQSTEVDMLWRLDAAGVRVPKSHAFFEGVLLMELITDDDGNAAPRLNDMKLTTAQACSYHDILIKQIKWMLCAGIIHGDLSAYNILISNQGPVIIDLPQAIDAAKNSNAEFMIKRDVKNITAYLSQFAPELANTDYGSEMWSLYSRGKLHAGTILTKCSPRYKKPVNIGSILQHINTAIRKENALQRYKEVVLQRYKQERWENELLSRC
jgi:RIO kinase 1